MQNQKTKEKIEEYEKEAKEYWGNEDWVTESMIIETTINDFLGRKGGVNDYTREKEEMAIEFWDLHVDKLIELLKWLKKKGYTKVWSNGYILVDKE